VGSFTSGFCLFDAEPSFTAGFGVNENEGVNRFYSRLEELA
jgi:hypothetical protein